MKVDVVGLDGKKLKSIDLPNQFSEDYEPDLVNRAVLVVFSHNRQPYGSFTKAGQGYSAKISRRRRDYKGAYGKGISRVPRKTMWRRGMQFGWVGALAPGTVGGRRAHAPKASKIWDLDINDKERRKAIRSAMNGVATKTKLVVVEEKFETLIAKTKSTATQKQGKMDKDLFEAEIDAEITRLKDAWAKENDELEDIRDQAKSELKSIKKYQVISELAYRDLSLKYGPVFSAGIGAEALKQLLEEEIGRAHV